MNKTILLALMAMISVSLSARELQTVRFTTIPQMHCSGCEKKIKGNLRFEKGIKMIETNVDSQTVIIRFDADKTSPEKLQKVLEKIGYKARMLKKGEKVVRQMGGSCKNM